jgi:hypothetical protein
MERFLSSCAEYINKKHAGKLDDLCLVFPGRRAGVFFNSYLQRQLDKPVIGPQIITVNELISGYSVFHQGEKLQLISELFDIFIHHTHSSESFDEFYFWGEVLLADFNDIDHYLVDARDLFSNLAGLKELEGSFDYLSPEQKRALERFWGSLSLTGEKAHHEKFLSIWQKLYPVYTDFRKYLQEAGMAYSGMMDREVIERFREKEPEFEFEKYYIIGLNVLNSCEKAFFNLLKQQNKVAFLWDYDRFYLEDDRNEAGRFIRENLKLFPPPEDFNLHFAHFQEMKNMKLVAVSSSYGQAQEIPRFLKDIQSVYKNEFDNTAVVLADESLLFPALGAIPADFGTVNVTMGYPVRNSVVYGFLLLLVNLLKNRRLDENGRQVVYYRYVTDILNHQLMGDVEPDKAAQFLARLKEKNLISVPLEEIDISAFHQLIFSLPEKVEDYSGWFLKILSRFYESVKQSGENNQLLAEMVYAVHTAVEKLDAVVSEVNVKHNRQISDSVYFRLFSQYVGQVSVAFEGEPLTGLQVMGILETRCLDFRNLIILGLNENKWPRTYTEPSFIPYNLRKGFGLPGIDEQDAMYAYYFYRLIQRAENVTATYNTLKEGISTGELSRYGYQLKYDSGLRVQDTTLDFRFINEPVFPIEVPGSPQKAALLFERNAVDRPLSPTAVNTWLHCSLRFYFRYILQLPEPDEMLDEIDSPVFGSIFHEVIEKLYRPWVGKTLNKEDIGKIRKDKLLIENEILKAIGKHFFRQTDEEKPVKPTGKTVLIYENIKTFVRQLLDIDMKITPFQLISLEENYQFQWNINANGRTFPVRIGGKIDRVDRVNGRLRILDYKTGNVESFSFKETEDLFEKNSEKPKKEILQALIYCLVYKESTGETNDLQPAIYSLRNLFDEKFSPEIKQNGSVVSFLSVENEFTGHLQNLVSEIFSENGRFLQTPRIKSCRYCPYNQICQRYSF